MIESPTSAPCSTEVSYDEAIRRVLQAVSPNPVRSFRLDLSDPARADEPLGTILAEPFDASLDCPPFDTAAVDGYGYCRGSAPGRLRLSETAFRIQTGNAIPPGIDAMAMQEDCVVTEDWVEVPPFSGKNHIRYRGEEYRSGDRLLPAGTPVTASALALLAANGRREFQAHRRPVAEILVTGDELSPVGSPLPNGCIYSSNGPCLTSAARSLGAVAQWSQAGDDLDRLCETLDASLCRADIVITTGGVSVGDRDVVKDCFERLGIEQRFWRVRIKPGKPVYFGIKGDTLVFGLPGSPAAAFTTFRLFVAPAIRGMLGHIAPEIPSLRCRLVSPLQKRAGRTEFVRARIDSLVASPIVGEGPGATGQFAQAEGLIHLPEGSEDFAAGDFVRVEPLTF